MQGAEKSLVEAASTGNLEKVDLAEKEKRLLEFAYLLTVSPYKNSPEEIEKLRDVGWTDGQIRESVLVISMFAMFNRVADAFGLQDPKYFEKAEHGKGITPASRSS